MPEEARTDWSVRERREIRVFISSTFRDMHEEREELIKQIFPQLRRLCESRGVTWGEVDLRWGVPDEAKVEGKVLPLCLEEIEHCRPYFIGILGERYGWVPEEIPEALFETQPWLREHLHQSVTALEILHGVLQNTATEKHAFFYFRDPAYAAARAGFVEEDPILREKLSALKEDIRNSGFPVQEPFATPKQLGEWVLRDLTAVIEKLYPEEEIPDALFRAALDHESYSASRRAVYIGRQEYLDSLDAHAAGTGPPLVLVGESGVGKSALLANWSHAWREQHAGTPVLVHFIGATPDSADWMAMLRRLLGEFKRRFDLQIDIPDRPDALRMTFANALHMVAARGRLVLVLDALNQIEDRDGAPDLVWLPPVIPANVRLIASTLPGRSWEELKKRNWPEMRVEPLTPPEREKLIGKYLLRYAKSLSLERTQRIVSAPQTRNGLYLTTLLNELRLFGSHSKLDARVEWYLEAANPVELYGKVIHRWEQDYRQPDPASANIVRESLTRLWAARRGLSEAELLDSLGTNGSPLPRVFWSPLYLAAGDALINRGGLLTFAHDFLREAVRLEYLSSERLQQDAHGTMAAYFKHQSQGQRQLDELPWQWQQAAEWQYLADSLADPSFFIALWKKDQFEVKAYWTKIETNSSLHLETAYAKLIDTPTRNLVVALQIGSFLYDMGRMEAALQIRRGLVEHYRAVSDRVNLAGALGNLANTIYFRGDLDDALAMYKEGEQLCRALGIKDGLQASLGNQALIRNARGDLNGAMALHKESERLCRELGNSDALQMSIGNQANILYSLGDLDGALELQRIKERMCRESGNKNGLQTSLGNQALILKARGDLDGAMALHKESERICRDIGNNDGLHMSLGNQALILHYRGDLDAALAMMKEQERLCRELGNKAGMHASLGNQASILKDRGDLDGALLLHKEEERICRELGDKNGLSASLGNQALILHSRGDLDAAMALMKEQERLCRELGNKDGVQRSLGNQAVNLRSRGDLNGAMALSKEQERLCRELGDKDSLEASLGTQANILYSQGNLSGAMALQKEKESLCRELGNPYGLAISLVNQAFMLRDIAGKRDEARRLAAEALEIASRHDYRQLIPQFELIRDSIPAE